MTNKISHYINPLSCNESSCGNYQIIEHNFVKITAKKPKQGSFFSTLTNILMTEEKITT